MFRSNSINKFNKLILIKTKTKLKCSHSYLNISKKYFNIKKEKESITAFHSKKEKDKSEVFADRINNIEKQDKGREEEFQDIESYLKVLNEKSNQENFEVIKKITEIFKEDNNSVKVFSIVQEINKINLANSSSILKTFLSNVLKYNESFKNYLEETNKINRRYKYLVPISLFIFSLIGVLYLKSQITFKSNKVALKVVNNYFDNLKYLFKLNIKFPIFNDHRNLTNSILFNDNNMLVIIGPYGVGKTESIKNYCFRESQNGRFLIYIDLKSEKYRNKGIQQILSDRLVEEVKPDSWLSFQLNTVMLRLGYSLNTDTFYNEIMKCLNDKDVTIILDNYTDEQDNQLVFSNLQFFKNHNLNVMILCSSNEILPCAIKGKKIIFSFR